MTISNGCETSNLKEHQANRALKLVCLYCGQGNVRKGSALIDGEVAHRACLRLFETTRGQ